jgi:hypothetical protein
MPRVLGHRGCWASNNLYTTSVSPISLQDPLTHTVVCRSVVGHWQKSDRTLCVIDTADITGEALVVEGVIV